MPNSQSSSGAEFAASLPSSEVIASASSSQDGDAALLTLQAQFDQLVGDLLALQQPDTGLAGPQQSPKLGVALMGVDADRTVKQPEEILAVLYPIEQAIMRARACSTAGLGVKARHAAYVMSEYWEAPIHQLDWEAQAVRSLIEAVCELAGTPLPLRNPAVDGRSPKPFRNEER